MGSLAEGAAREARNWHSPSKKTITIYRIIELRIERRRCSDLVGHVWVQSRSVVVRNQHRLRAVRLVTRGSWAGNFSEWLDVLLNFSGIDWIQSWIGKGSGWVHCSQQRWWKLFHVLFNFGMVDFLFRPWIIDFCFFVGWFVLLLPQETGLPWLGLLIDGVSLGSMDVAFEIKLDD